MSLAVKNSERELFLLNLKNFDPTSEILWIESHIVNWPKKAPVDVSMALKMIATACNGGSPYIPCER
jgi:hypothetical protein